MTTQATILFSIVTVGHLSLIVKEERGGRERIRPRENLAKRLNFWLFNQKFNVGFLRCMFKGR